MSSIAIQEWIARNGVKKIPVGVRTLTEKQIKNKIRGIDFPQARERDYVNERHEHIRSDGSVLVVNGYGERII